MNLFKSKEEKALEAKIAVNRVVQSAKRQERMLEKKRDELIKYAQEAKKQGITQQYGIAKNGLRMVMQQLTKVRTLVMHLQLTQTVRDITVMGSDFIKIVGKVGKELSSLSIGADFAKNQIAYEKGMMASQMAMDQLDNFLEDAGMTFAESSDEDMDAELERMIDSTGAVKADPVDDEIEARIKQLQMKQSEIKA